MSIRITNSFSRQMETLETIEPHVVRLYVCGVTVYDAAHIGHAMSALVFDVVRRYLEHRGYQVRHVVNFTDVDDKIIRRSLEEGVSAYEIADRYARDYLIGMKRLNVLPATLYPRVSSEMPAIIAMIQTLVAKDQAYAAENGDVYFRSRRFHGYGRLSGRSFEDAESQEPESGFKEDPADFALWKAAKPGEPAWDSPWGQGRPGWHIECSAMAGRHLGEQIDIHGGGMDLLFPHHENEIAQSEAASGCHPFSRIWMHNGMLRVNGEKMSKSLGNFITLDDFLARFDPDVLRLLVLSSHYRKPVNYTDEAILASQKGLERLWGALKPARPGASGHQADIDRLVEAASQTCMDLDRAMDDDFGTPGALSALFGLVTEINRARDAGVDAESLGQAQATLASLGGILGLDLPRGAAHMSRGAGGDHAVDGLMALVLELRARAREARDWAASDTIRDRLAELGLSVVDTPDGATWRHGN
ncbi:MAG: cysteine--tRNA ligase [Anaerolineae bacterium]|nr:cysteine--tRNA ligase [Ardenticatenia bacterium]HQZ72274.1 cysteine--tRNA ligase [Anaerolineae bacterium]